MALSFNKLCSGWCLEISQKMCLVGSKGDGLALSTREMLTTERCLLSYTAYGSLGVSYGSVGAGSLLLDEQI